MDQQTFTLLNDTLKRLEEGQLRIEEKVDTGFKALNGRVHKVEKDIFRIKTVWSAISISGGFLIHLLKERVWPTT